MVRTGLAPEQRVPMVSWNKTHFDGTHRVTSPAETVARVRRAFAPMGITRVADVTGLDCIGLPVVAVYRPNGRSLSVSQGKGVDLDCARASGVMEAVELYHAERVMNPLKLASYLEMSTAHSLVAVDELPRTDQSIYRADRPLLWIEGTDLMTGSNAWLPYELVHLNYTLPLPPGTGCFVLSSNGLASGNHMLEAIVHGLCEVIERDATSVFRCHSEQTQDAHKLDLSTIDDELCLSVLTKYERAGMAVAVWDITSDIQVPTYKCVIMERDPNTFRPIGAIEGFGCHPTREVALLRALTEAAQGRLTLIAGARDDNHRTKYAAVQDGEQMRRSLSRLAVPGTRIFSAGTSFMNPTLEADLQLILQQLTQAGIRKAYVVDLTKPEFAIPVARVVVPGLETYHHVPGYKPGARALAVLKQWARA